MTQNEIHDNKVQRGVFRSLVRFFQPSVEKLIDCLDDGYGLLTTAKDAEKKLVKRGAEAIPQLREALESPYPDVKTSAVKVLGKIGDPHAAEVVAGMIDDLAVKDTVVLSALADMTGEEGKMYLETGHTYLEKIMNEGPGTRLRIKAARLLANAGDEYALEQLLDYAEHDGVPEACTALADFLEIREVADILVGKLVERRSVMVSNLSPTTMAAFSALATMDGQTRPALFAALSSEDDSLAEAAANFLTHDTRDARFMELNLEMLKYHNEEHGCFSRQIERLEEQCRWSGIRLKPDRFRNTELRKAFPPRKVQPPRAGRRVPERLERAIKN